MLCDLRGITELLGHLSCEWDGHSYTRGKWEEIILKIKAVLMSSRVGGGGGGGEVGMPKLASTLVSL